ncbi:hypothetical protein ZWY2020_042422 [Hordeum vulgare]|nr:hypothetical protein ZWY2020_042422 [Hordeum vulgare]
MPSASSPSGRERARGRWCARRDLLTVAVTVMLCSATYCFSIWHNGRNAPDKIVLGRTPFFVAGAATCRGDASVLDFETHHTAERAGLSVSSSSSPTVTGRRALRAAVVPVDGTVRGRVALAGNSAGSPEDADGKEWARVNGDKLRVTHAGAVRA